MWNFNGDASRLITNALAFWYFHSVYLEDRHYKVRIGVLESLAVYIVGRGWTHEQEDARFQLTPAEECYLEAHL